MRSISLFWSLAWRLALLLSALSWAWTLAIQFVVPGSLGSEGFIKYKSTAIWWLHAVFLWTLAAASPAFLRRLLWGERLRMDDRLWLYAFRAIAVCLAALGAVNLAVADLWTTDAWVTFKVFGQPLVFFGSLFVVAILVRRSQDSTASRP